MKQALGLIVALCSIPLFAIAFAIFIMAGIFVMAAEALKGAGEWIAK